MIESRELIFLPHPPSVSHQGFHSWGGIWPSSTTRHPQGPGGSRNTIAICQAPSSVTRAVHSISRGLEFRFTDHFHLCCLFFLSPGGAEGGAVLTWPVGNQVAAGPTHCALCRTEEALGSRVRKRSRLSIAPRTYCCRLPGKTGTFLIWGSHPKYRVWT